MDKVTEIRPEYRPEWDTEEYWAEDPPVVNTDRSAPFDPLGGVMWLEGSDEPTANGPDEDGTAPAEAGGGTEPLDGEAV